MNKEMLLGIIINTIAELKDLGNGNSGTLFLNGDAETMLSHISLNGNMEVLAVAFGNKMENNEEFKKVMMSMFGAYLKNNQEDKEKFIQSMSLTDFPISLN